MFEFFNQIVGFFETVFSFFVNMINSLLILINTLLSVATLPVTLLPFLPAVIGTAVTITVALGIVKMVVGR